MACPFPCAGLVIGAMILVGLRICQYECSEINIQYYLEDDIEIFGVGRAKYFKNKECKVESLKAIRTIYFPFEELMIEKGAKA